MTETKYNKLVHDKILDIIAASDKDSTYHIADEEEYSDMLRKKLDEELAEFSLTPTAGHFDLDAELKVWVSGSPTPIERKFNKSLNIYQLQSVLAQYVLK